VPSWRRMPPAATSRVMPQGFAKAKPIKEQIDLMAILKDCRVESFYEDIRIDSYLRMVVKYRHAPNEPRTAMDDEAARRCAGLLPVGAGVTMRYEMIDVTHLGDPYRSVEVDRPVGLVEVVFA
jgi:hypothetical protein